MNRKLVIFGTSNIAECAYEYFMHDSDYEVVAFTVDQEYLEKTRREFTDKPLVAFEEVERIYPPNEHSIFIAVGSQKLNRLRTNKVEEAVRKGYKLASYVSSKAFIWQNVKFGEHVFIQENNTLQPFVKIGNNVTLWAGNHIGHATEIEDNCFIASQVAISGHCKIELNSFIGVNVSIADNIRVGADNFIGMGAIITSNTKENSLYVAGKSILSKIQAKKFCKVKDD